MTGRWLLGVFLIATPVWAQFAESQGFKAREPRLTVCQNPLPCVELETFCKIPPKASAAVTENWNELCDERALKGLRSVESLLKRSATLTILDPSKVRCDSVSSMKPYIFSPDRERVTVEYSAECAKKTQNFLYMTFHELGHVVSMGHAYRCGGSFTRWAVGSNTEMMRGFDAHIGEKDPEVENGEMFAFQEGIADFLSYRWLKLGYPTFISQQGLFWEKADKALAKKTLPAIARNELLVDAYLRKNHATTSLNKLVEAFCPSAFTLDSYLKNLKNPPRSIKRSADSPKW